MATISPTSAHIMRFVPPTPSPPSPPPPPTGGGGAPVDETVVVWGSRTPTRPPPSAYGGLTGAAENSRRNAEWAAMSPSQRAEAMGYLANMQIDDLAGQTDDWGIDEIASLLPPELAGEAARLAFDAAAEISGNSLDFAILGRAGELEVRREMARSGWQEIGSQVRVLIFDKDKRPQIRVYDFLAFNALGELTFLEVKTNGATRNARQIAADEAFMENGGLVATNRLGGYPMGTSLGPFPVDVVNVQIRRFP